MDRGQTWVPFQRDEPGDVLAVRKRIADLTVEVARAREAHDSRALLRALGQRGDLCRIAGEAEEARADLREAVRLARRLGDGPAVAANRIRLATARFYAGDHPLAEAELRSVVDDLTAAGETKHLDYAWQHLGKCLAEQGKLAAAAGCFENALALRADQPELAGSSRRALEGLNPAPP